MTQLNVFKLSFITLMAIVLLGAVYFFTQVTVQTTVIITEGALIEENGKHYLLFEQHQLRLNEAMVQSIQNETEKEYNITYSYNLIFPKKGKVERLSVYGLTQ